MSQAPFEQKVGRARVAGGLAWTPLVGETAPKVRAEFKRHLRNNRAAYGAVIPVSDHQRYAMAGVVTPVKGAKAPSKFQGMVPAAAWFAASGTTPRAYVEKIGPGRYWTLVALGRALDPRTDAVQSREEVTALVNEIGREAALNGQEFTLTVWPGVPEMPEELAYQAGVTAAPLERCLTAGAQPKLRVRKHVGIPAWVGQAVAAGVVLAGGLYALDVARDTYQAQMAAREEAARERAAAEQARLAQAAQIANATNPEAQLAQQIETALATPAPAAVIDACLAVARGLPQSVGGWRLSNVACATGRETEATYEADQKHQALATQESFAAAMDAMGLPYAYSWFERKATVRIGAVDLASRAAPALEELPDMQATGTWWSSHVQRAQAFFRGVRITVDSRVDPVRPDQPAPAFIARPVQFAGTASWQLHEAIPDASNLVLETVVLKPQPRGAWSWSAMGALYHTPESS